MKKRVAISTWTGKYSLNYGSASQTAALQELVRKCGCEPVTIDNYYDLNQNSIRRRYYRQGMRYIRTSQRFQLFYQKYVKLSPVCKTDAEVIQYVKGKFDILLCGSDAIWFKPWIRALFLWDYEELDYPCVAYAPSIPRGGRWVIQI